MPNTIYMTPPCTVYDPDRTYVVQQLNGNILVRGNLPIDESGAFAFDALSARLGELIDGFSMSNYRLIDVSLIDNQGELPELTDEFEAYDAGAVPTEWPPYAQGVDIFKQYGASVNGNPGSLMWMPVQGCLDQDNCSAVEPSLYNLAGVVDQLNTLMQSEVPTVIYYHCMNGHDRAGSLTACYMMKYMDRTRAQAMDLPPPEGAKAMKHPWHETYGPLIEWYASTIGK